MVVDTETIGKKLLQHGDLRRRYTIIPLNKISARAIDDSVVRRAQNLVSSTIYASKQSELGVKVCFGLSSSRV